MNVRKIAARHRGATRDAVVPMGARHLTDATETTAVPAEAPVLEIGGLMIVVPETADREIVVPIMAREIEVLMVVDRRDAALTEEVQKVAGQKVVARCIGVVKAIIGLGIVSRMGGLRWATIAAVRSMAIAISEAQIIGGRIIRAQIIVDRCTMIVAPAGGGVGIAMPTTEVETIADRVAGSKNAAVARGIVSSVRAALAVDVRKDPVLLVVAKDAGRVAVVLKAGVVAVTVLDRNAGEIIARVPIILPITIGVDRAGMTRITDRVEIIVVPDITGRLIMGPVMTTFAITADPEVRTLHTGASVETIGTKGIIIGQDRLREDQASMLSIATTAAAPIIAVQVRTVPPWATAPATEVLVITAPVITDGVAPKAMGRASVIITRPIVCWNKPTRTRMAS